MNVVKNSAIALIVFLPAVATGDSFLSDANVKYVGDADAIRVCKAVVDDNSSDLKLLLSKHRNDLLYGYSFKLVSRAVSGSFTCDDLGLMDFAYEIGSAGIVGYLQGGTVTIEEVAGTTN